MLDPLTFDIALRLAGAWICGSLVGLERSYHGRPAGFRTHALVSLASALLMLLTSFPEQWLRHLPEDTLQADPTRVAQGIMTGVGFIGAGVIFREGITVRGLTTAASIWITAALGILYGAGFFMPALIGTAATLLTLATFLYVERCMPTQHFAQCRLRFQTPEALTPEQVRALVARHGFRVTRLGQRVWDDGQRLDYDLTLYSHGAEQLEALADTLRQHREVRGFSLSPGSPH